MQYFQHFACNEFFPNCSQSDIGYCVSFRMLDNLLNLLQVLDCFRSKLGFPIIITSTYRSYFHNKEVGGSPTSQHLTASAIDFSCPRFDFEGLCLQFEDFLKESAFKNLVGQVIFYHKRKFIHFGLRTPRHHFLNFLHYEQGDN